MNLLVVGDNNHQAEFKAKFSSKHSITYKNCTDLAKEDLELPEVIFDFQISNKHKHGQMYAKYTQATLMVNSVKTTVADLVKHFAWNNEVIGFNGLPGMFDRPLLELAPDGTDQLKLAQLCQQLQTDYRIVSDKVGMVTPRVVCMIINEACYTVQEGTAVEEDIDLAMKLGTNYPAGPFEMLEAIGVNNVYELLEALYQATGETRYQVCPLLAKQYQQENSGLFDSN